VPNTAPPRTFYRLVGRTRIKEPGIANACLNRYKQQKQMVNRNGEFSYDSCKNDKELVRESKDACIWVMM
jgi:hypothetical protein